jgi:TRAP-type mannitol/chloroaromatic compound transport system permease small subunit
MTWFTRLQHARIALRTALDRSAALAAWLVLPLALLLFAQWPLRDLVGAFSRQANDIAQWLFALYLAFALREATRRGAHLAAGLPAASAAPRWRRLVDRWGEAVLVLPWAIFVLVVGAAPTWRSVVSLEAFPDSFNPLYFVIRLSAWLLALGVALEALLALTAPGADAKLHSAGPDATAG